VAGVHSQEQSKVIAALSEQGRAHELSGTGGAY